MREALKQLNIKAHYEQVANVNIMKAIGLEYTPALEIDGKLISQGKFYKLDEMKSLLLSHTDNHDRI